ncbi:MAG: AMP-binding protein, partial [Actinomycetota bacterium]|nr:AMP-binding protein [Actinomycetota bacterium]
MKHAWDQPLGVWNIAESHPDAVAIATCPSGETLTFAALAGRCHQIVHALRARGIGPGDVVAMALPNDVDIVLWLLASQEGGFRSLALNPALSDAEIEGILRHSGAKAVVAHAALAGRLTDVAAVQDAALRLSVGGAVPGFDDAATHLGTFPTTLPSDRVLGGPVFYSSGTTGAPKGIWRAIPPVDPTLAADAMKSFGQAFQ